MGLQSNFGAGYLWGTVSGGTPRLFAALQDITVDVSRDLKALYGQNQFPIEQAQGKAKIECKASLGRIDPNVFNDLYFGVTASTGLTAASNLEAGTIPTTPYQITVSNSATWATDLGVYDKNTGVFLTKVGSGATPTTGQYKVTAGVYTFAAADAAHLVAISYTYTATSGYTVATLNPVMGATVIFRADLFNSFRSKPFGITLFACQSSKLSFPMKQDDFTLPAIDFSAQDDGSGNVMGLYGQGGY